MKKIIQSYSRVYRYFNALNCTCFNHFLIRIDKKLESLRSDLDNSLESLKLRRIDERIRCSTPNLTNENSFPLITHSLPVTLNNDGESHLRKVSSKFQRISKKIKLKQSKLGKMKKSTEAIMNQKTDSSNPQPGSEICSSFSTKNRKMLEDFRTLNISRLNKAIGKVGDLTLNETLSQIEIDMSSGDPHEIIELNDDDQTVANETLTDEATEVDFSFWGIL